MILVVDDNVDWAIALGRLFREDYRVSTDITDALLLARGLKPRIVILDVDMGTELSIYRIRDFLEVSPDSKIALITGRMNESHGIKAITEGALFYLSKCDAVRLPELIYEYEAFGPERPQKRPSHLKLVSLS